MSKYPKQDFVTIVVLNDGSTYSTVKGCSICIIPVEQLEAVENSGGDAADFNPIVEIGLDSIGGIG
jgi:hypothetical protein